MLQRQLRWHQPQAHWHAGQQAVQLLAEAPIKLGSPSAKQHADSVGSSM